jgi:hypothetical protein
MKILVRLFIRSVCACLALSLLACEKEGGKGRYTGHIPVAVFDRLRIKKDEPDWDRCLVLDHDIVGFSDLGEYFDEDSERNLLMGRLFGEGNTLGLQNARTRGLPESLAHAGDYPYFLIEAACGSGGSGLMKKLGDRLSPRRAGTGCSSHDWCRGLFGGDVCGSDLRRVHEPRPLAGTGHRQREPATSLALSCGHVPWCLDRGAALHGDALPLSNDGKAFLR